MIKKIKALMITLASVGTLLVPSLAVVTVHAQSDTIGPLTCGTDLNTGDNCTPKDASKFGDVLTTVINIFSIIVGFVSVIMIIVGGLQYITSGGDSTKIQTAKNTILYAVIGLVVVALAQLIVRFVLDKIAPAANA